MILFHKVVEILDLADFDGGAVFVIVALDSRFIGRTPIDGDLFWHAMAADRFGQEPLGGFLITLCCQEEVDRPARLIHGAIQMAPLAFHLDVGLVHPPADPHRSLGVWSVHHQSLMESPLHHRPCTPCASVLFSRVSMRTWCERWLAVGGWSAHPLDYVLVGSRWALTEGGLR